MPHSQTGNSIKGQFSLVLNTARRGPYSCRVAALGWEQDADDTAFRPESPGDYGESGEDERSEDVKGVCAVTADGGAGGGCAGEVEEDAGIGPFLEARKTRHENGNGSHRFPESQDREEVEWVAKFRHDTVWVSPKLPDLREAAASDKKRDERSHGPVENVS